MPVPSHVVIVSVPFPSGDRVWALRAYDRQEADDLAGAARAWGVSDRVGVRVEVVPVRRYVRPDRLAAELGAEMAADVADGTARSTAA